MKYLGIAIVMCMLFAATTRAQEPIPAPPEAPETPETGETGEAPETADETGTETEVAPLNQSEQEKVSRLAAASGKSEAEILALRNGTPLPPPESVGPEAGEPPIPEDGEPPALEKKMGWGQVAHELGLHPGILGHGTGDKFMPPELPEIDAAAMAAVTTARERAMERKAVRQETHAIAKQSHRDAKTDRTRGPSAAQKDRVEKASKPEKPGKPEKVAKPEKAAKPEKSNNSGNGKKR